MRLLLTTMTRPRPCLPTPKSACSRKANILLPYFIFYFMTLRLCAGMCGYILYTCTLLYIYSMYNVCEHTVLKEVENQVGKFRDDLRKKLLKLPSSLEEQKKVIK